jgi:hypothetical protein
MSMGGAAAVPARLLAGLREGGAAPGTRRGGGPLVAGQTGLRNLGNTCFMNATIHALSNTPPLRDFFLHKLLPPQTPVPFQDTQLWRQNTMDCIQAAEQKRKSGPRGLQRQTSLCLELHNLLRVIWSGKFAVVGCRCERSVLL